jgi:hypothetical protein
LREVLAKPGLAAFARARQNAANSRQSRRQGAEFAAPSLRREREQLEAIGVKKWVLAELRRQNEANAPARLVSKRKAP